MAGDVRGAVMALGGAAFSQGGLAIFNLTRRHYEA